MMTVETIGRIRRAYLVEGESIRGIALRLYCYYINGSWLEIKSFDTKYSDPYFNCLLCWDESEELQKLVAGHGFEVLR